MKLEFSKDIFRQQIGQICFILMCWHMCLFLMIILFLCKEFILTDYIFLARLGQLTLILLLYCHCYILPFIFVIVYIKVVFLSAVADDTISKRGAGIKPTGFTPPSFCVSTSKIGFTTSYVVLLLCSMICWLWCLMSLSTLF